MDQPTPRRLPFYFRPVAFFLRIFFALLYHQLAWSYDLVASFVSVGMWQDWVRSTIPYLSGPRVLELGHGPGHLQAAAGQAGKICLFGLDRSPQMGRLARRRLHRLNLPQRLVNGQAQALPFSGGSFQQVVATFPTEYIAHPQTLAEINRVLAPGGMLVVLPVAWITGRSLRHRLAALLNRLAGQAPHLDERIFFPAVDLLKSAGFDPRLEYLDLPASRLLVILAVKDR